MSEKRRIVLNTFAHGSSQLIAMASAFVFMPLLVRGFGLNEYGLYLLASSVGGYAAILDLGVGSALMKMVAEKAARNEREQLSALVSTALTFYTGIGVLVAGLLVVVGLHAGDIFHVNEQGARLLRNLLLIVAVTQLWGWPASTAGYVLMGFQRFTLTARVGIGITLGNVAAIVAVLVAHRGPLLLTALSGGVGVLGTLAMVVLARRQLHGVDVSPFQPQLSVARSILTFSWAIFVIQLSAVIVYQQTDRVVLGIFVGAASIGLYEAAGKFQGFVSQLLSLSVSAVLPAASGLDAEGRKTALQGLFFRGNKYTVSFVAPIVVVLLVLAKPLINGWLGPAFATQALAARILVAPQLLLCSLTLGDSIMTAMGKLPQRIPYVIAFTAANLVLSLILVQSLGIMGVVLGTTIPYLVDFPFHIRLLLRQVDVRFRDWARLVVRPTYPLLVIPAGMCLLALFTPLTSRLIGVGIVAAVSLVAYWVTLFFLGFSSSERQEVTAVLRAARSQIAARRA